MVTQVKYFVCDACIHVTTVKREDITKALMQIPYEGSIEGNELLELSSKWHTGHCYSDSNKYTSKVRWECSCDCFKLAPDDEYLPCVVCFKPDAEFEMDYLKD